MGNGRLPLWSEIVAGSASAMRNRSVDMLHEGQPIVQYFTALNSPLPSNRPSTQALSTLDGFLTQPLRYMEPIVVFPTQPMPVIKIRMLSVPDVFSKSEHYASAARPFASAGSVWLGIGSTHPDPALFYNRCINGRREGQTWKKILPSEYTGYSIHAVRPPFNAGNLARNC